MTMPDAEPIPPTEHNIRAVAHNALQAAIPEWMKLSDRVRVSEAVLAAVEPLIRASEREACAQLADKHRASYTRSRGPNVPGVYRPFADLLREGP